MTWRDYTIAALLLAVMALVWHEFTPKPAPVNEWEQAKPAPQVADMPKVAIQPEKVIVYAQPAKAKLDLPPEVRANKAVVVVAASRIAPDLHPQTVTALLDPHTGEFTTLVRREPYPWLAAEQTGELRLDYGYKNGMVKVARLSLHENLVQIKALHLGVSASVDTSGQFFIGAGVGWGW